MKRGATIAIGSLAVLAAVEAALLGLLAQRARWSRYAAATPAARGRQLAERLGCFGCHGPGGVRPIPNPGARTGEVPDWSGGTWMMWNRTEADVRGWIANGRADAIAADSGALIAMPAYGDLLTEAELDDLVAFVLAVSSFGTPEDAAAARGRDVAVRLGCHGCHGPEGRGGVANPGSLKGYVPGWDGADFAELVRDASEFREWVRDGVCARLKANPAARWFVEGQRTQMPAYGDRVSEAELDELLAWVEWIRRTPRDGKASP